MSKQMSWTLRDGTTTVTVTTNGGGHYIWQTSDGRTGNGGINAKLVPAAAKAAGVVAIIPGGLALDAEHKAALEALSQAADGEHASDPRTALMLLESDLDAAREALSTYGYNTYRIAKETQAEAAAKHAELRQSYIARGLD